MQIVRLSSRHATPATSQPSPCPREEGWRHNVQCPYIPRVPQCLSPRWYWAPHPLSRKPLSPQPTQSDDSIPFGRIRIFLFLISVIFVFSQSTRSSFGWNPPLAISASFLDRMETTSHATVHLRLPSFVYVCPSCSTFCVKLDTDFHLL